MTPNTYFVLAVEPQIVLYPSDSEFFAGSTVRLSCTAHGIPLPSIEWSRGGVAMPVDDSRVTMWDETVVMGGHTFKRSHLQICSTVELDSGLYSCGAVTVERQQMVEFGVTVVGVPPTLIQTPGTFNGFVLLHSMTKFILPFQMMWT